MESLCAIAIVVRPSESRSRASCTSCSVWVSSEEVASSRTRTGGLRRIVRAIAIRCFSPPEKRYPRSPTTVSYPSGSVATSSWICAARAAYSISASVASGRAKRRFSRTVAWKRYVSCETTPTVEDSDSNVSSRTSTPSMETVPRVPS